jgi:hypothetical protein
MFTKEFRLAVTLVCHSHLAYVCMYYCGFYLCSKEHEGV